MLFVTACSITITGRAGCSCANPLYLLCISGCSLLLRLAIKVLLLNSAYTFEGVSFHHEHMYVTGSKTMKF